MEMLSTCSEILQHLQSQPSNPALLNWHNDNGWHSLSTKEFLDHVKYLALGLHHLGIRHGQAVGLLAVPSPYWTIADFAIMIAGGVTQPLFGNISQENFLYEISQTRLKIIFVAGEEEWSMFQRHSAEFHTAIALTDETMKHEKIRPLKELLSLGEQIDRVNPELYQQLVKAIKPSDISTIIYTSGSTGVPKGVQLTQQNICCLVHYDGFRWKTSSDRYLSILPLAHVFGRSINLWMLTWNISTYYSNDYKNLGNICREIHPTVMVVVPRLLEKIYDKMVENVHHANTIVRKVGEWAFSLAHDENPSLYKRLLKPIANALVYSKIRFSLGGALRVVISGGAHLNPHLNRFFDAIGITIYEGWGLTEACPVCVNSLEKHKVGSVGLPLPDQRVKIGENGEILVKGPLVMYGYYRNLDETGKLIDADGWLHTGDRGIIDEEGYLTILGRIKELYKTSTGEYVAPIPIEQALCRHPLIDMAMVIADERKFASCLLFPNHEVLQRMKSQHNGTDLSDEAFLQSPFIQRDINRLIERINLHLNHWEQLHAYRFITDPLTIQGGELTPSMKMRREIIANKYQMIIDNMYNLRLS